MFMTTINDGILFYCNLIILVENKQNRKDSKLGVCMSSFLKLLCFMPSRNRWFRLKQFSSDCRLCTFNNLVKIARAIEDSLTRL